MLAAGHFRRAGPEPQLGCRRPGCIHRCITTASANGIGHASPLCGPTPRCQQPVVVEEPRQYPNQNSKPTAPLALAPRCRLAQRHHAENLGRVCRLCVSWWFLAPLKESKRITEQDNWYQGLLFCSKLEQKR